jgi:hypothetical protein
LTNGQLTHYSAFAIDRVNHVARLEHPITRIDRVLAGRNHHHAAADAYSRQHGGQLRVERDADDAELTDQLVAQIDAAKDIFERFAAFANDHRHSLGDAVANHLECRDVANSRSQHRGVHGARVPEPVLHLLRSFRRITEVPTPRRRGARASGNTARTAAAWATRLSWRARARPEAPESYGRRSSPTGQRDRGTLCSDRPVRVLRLAADCERPASRASPDGFHRSLQQASSASEPGARAPKWSATDRALVWYATDACEAARPFGRACARIQACGVTGSNLRTLHASATRCLSCGALRVPARNEIFNRNARAFALAIPEPTARFPWWSCAPARTLRTNQHVDARWSSGGDCR